MKKRTPKAQRAGAFGEIRPKVRTRAIGDKRKRAAKRACREKERADA